MKKEYGGYFGGGLINWNDLLLKKCVKCGKEFAFESSLIDKCVECQSK